MNKNRKFVITSEARVYRRQHKAPCSDCPWARKSIPGWLGPYSVKQWLAFAHGESAMPCHTRAAPEDTNGTVRYENGQPHWQCAGMAIYRANVCKSPRDPRALDLPADKVKVFGFHEFEEHHS